MFGVTRGVVLCRCVCVTCDLLTFLPIGVQAHLCCDPRGNQARPQLVGFVLCGRFSQQRAHSRPHRARPDEAVEVWILSRPLGGHLLVGVLGTNQQVLVDPGVAGAEGWGGGGVSRMYKYVYVYVYVYVYR